MIDKIMSFFIPFITIFIPKNKKKWVFSSWGGSRLADSPKAFQEWIVNNSKDVRCIWIVKNKSLVCQEKGVFYYKSIWGLWHQATAKIVFVTHSINSDLYRPVIAHNTLRVQMWHGAALKKIGFDDTVFNKHNAVSRTRIYRYLSNEYYSIILSLGPLCSKDFQSAFGVDDSRLLEVGFPRNDIMLKEPKKHDDLIIYLPTFRGKPGESIDILQDAAFDLVSLDEKLAKAGLTLIVRLHPVNKLPDYYTNTTNIIFDNDVELYDLLARARALITDYSSVMFDFAATGKPILFLAHDLSEYLNNDREMYFDYHELGAEHIFGSWNEIASEFESLGAHKDNAFLKSYHATYHKSSSRSLYEYLANKIRIN
ncbi:CDP-glycerol glycerophosphotransferase family protein [Pseudoalteromonas sp. T1lg75]|uniref:CDP-glycerol glycerophosphotransferase family protein n=1 Tax=Pseudoalteromonas sp. T1lg75 TaxID=2077102 RepID=UPI000CF66936|nr:CDP-glycerol glycerophosphotransferase family protein [Pseudoalteromonas sp. T1lg75]